MTSSRFENHCSEEGGSKSIGYPGFNIENLRFKNVNRMTLVYCQGDLEYQEGLHHTKY